MSNKHGTSRNDTQSLVFVFGRCVQLERSSAPPPPAADGAELPLKRSQSTGSFASEASGGADNDPFYENSGTAVYAYPNHSAMSVANVLIFSFTIR